MVTSCIGIQYQTCYQWHTTNLWLQRLQFCHLRPWKMKTPPTSANRRYGPAEWNGPKSWMPEVHSRHLNSSNMELDFDAKYCVYAAKAFVTIDAGVELWLLYVCKLSKHRYITATHITGLAESVNSKILFLTTSRRIYFIKAGNAAHWFLRVPMPAIIELFHFVS